MIDISIIIPVYNAELLIKRCLDSILAQKGHYSYEVILVDDGSTDDSTAIIESYENLAFRLLHQKNTGPASARNRGIKLAQGRYIAFLDADDYWEDSFIKKTVSFLDTHTDCIAVSVGQRHCTVSGNFIVPCCLNNFQNPIVINDFFSFWARYQHVCTGSMVAKLEVVREVGTQRIDLRITEDLEFWFLLATYGKWGMIPEILFTSDGTMVIDKEGWLKKMQIRWNNAPKVSEWERRLINRNLSLRDNVDYLRARGIVARNLVYCQILSNRESGAREEAIRYGKYFKKDLWAWVMNICKYTPVTWWLICRVIQYREYHRKV